MDFSDIFRIVNLAVGAFMVLGGLGQFFPNIYVHNSIVGIYIILFGLANALLEFQIPPQISRYASFMFYFIGRGVFYIFVGCIIIGDKWWTIGSGGIVTLIGIGYVVLEFTPSIEPPANMRDAEASAWGAEQV